MKIEQKTKRVPVAVSKIEMGYCFGYVEAAGDGRDVIFMRCSLPPGHENVEKVFAVNLASGVNYFFSCDELVVERSAVVRIEE